MTTGASGCFCVDYLPDACIIINMFLYNMPVFLLLQFLLTFYKTLAIGINLQQSYSSIVFSSDNWKAVFIFFEPY